MISRSLSCSHCHAMNSLDDPTTRHCAECGHRADLPRSACDCPRCVASPEERRARAEQDMAELLRRVERNGGDLGAVLDEEIDPAEEPTPLAPPEKVYRGERMENGTADVTVNGRPLDPRPSQKVWNHSPDGFEWGYSGSGPAQLALAILLDATGDAEAARDHYQDFKRAHVARWGDEWAITAGEIHAWLEGRA